MKSLVYAATALVLAGSASQAISYVRVVGSGPGYACYKAARDQQSHSEAVKKCDQALASDLHIRDRAATHVNRGVMHLLRERYDQAMRDFDMAANLNPREPEAFLNKGILMLRNDGQARDVIQLADAALAHGTRKPALAHYTRAVAHEETGNLRAAYRDYRQAAALAPDWDLPGQDLKRFVVR